MSVKSQLTGEFEEDTEAASRESPRAELLRARGLIGKSRGPGGTLQRHSSSCTLPHDRPPSMATLRSSPLSKSFTVPHVLAQPDGLPLQHERSESPPTPTQVRQQRLREHGEEEEEEVHTPSARHFHPLGHLMSRGLLHQLKLIAADHAKEVHLNLPPRARGISPPPSERPPRPSPSQGAPAHQQAPLVVGGTAHFKTVSMRSMEEEMAPSSPPMEVTHMSPIKVPPPPATPEGQSPQAEPQAATPAREGATPPLLRPVTPQSVARLSLPASSPRERAASPAASSIHSR